MVTYELKKAPGVPLYEALYRHLREDILSGALRPGEKLPSKRALAAHLEVSKLTVETAYNQLLSEGYLSARERVGYFVEAVRRPESVSLPPQMPEEKCLPAGAVDLTANATGEFPFSVWSRLQRQVMLDVGKELLRPLPNRGLPELRRAIAEHLAAFRGMKTNPENILIGAGTDFLYNLLIQLLGRDKRYAVEEPGYGKIRRIYEAGGVDWVGAPLDSSGVNPRGLQDVHVLHLSPNHHFPTGLVTPMGRRLELLEWTAQAQNRYLIEDDYDSEFRFDAHPMPTMQSMDHTGRVIYMNSFSKSLAPSIRISYLVLPGALMERFQRELGFYSCTVASFEQYTLARFLKGGYFEKHINRMRKAYKARRNQVIDVLRRCPLSSKLTILEQNAGLHFLVRVDTCLSDGELVERCRQAGLLVRTLGSYYSGSVPACERCCLVVNYSGLDGAHLTRLEEILKGM